MLDRRPESAYIVVIPGTPRAYKLSLVSHSSMKPFAALLLLSIGFLPLAGCGRPDSAVVEANPAPSMSDEEYRQQQIDSMTGGNDTGAPN